MTPSGLPSCGTADSTGLLTVVVIIFFLVFAVLSMSWRSSRAHSILDGWAQANGFEIVSQEKCYLSKGPFFWTSSKGQDVYRIVAKDKEGRTKTGYARCGGFMVGMLSDQIDVRWDE